MQTRSGPTILAADPVLRRSLPEQRRLVLCADVRLNEAIRWWHRVRSGRSTGSTAH